MYPDELRYTAEHEWVRRTDSGSVVFGITHYAQEALGDIVFVSLPGVGDALVAGASCGEVESTKSVSDLYAPVAGVVVAVNPKVDGAPETINADPYGEGWLVELEPADPAALDTLLTPGEYRALVEKA